MREANGQGSDLMPQRQHRRAGAPSWPSRITWHRLRNGCVRPFRGLRDPWHKSVTVLKKRGLGSLQAVDVSGCGGCNSR